MNKKIAATISAMKKASVATLLLATLSCATFAQDDPAPTAVPDPPLIRRTLNPRKVTITVTIDLLPGQEVELINPAFSYIRVNSDSPVVARIGGKCQATETTDLICHTMPNIDVHFQDSRIGVPVDSAPINHVRFTAIRDDPDQ